MRYLFFSKPVSIFFVFDFFYPAVIDFQNCEFMALISDYVVLSGQFSLDFQNQTGQGIGFSFDIFETIRICIYDFNKII